MGISILDIKKRADLLCRNYFKNIYTIFLIVNTITVLIQMIPNGIISIVLSFLTVTLSHSYVIVSMKLINNDADKIETKDVFTGYSSFQKIFPAYLMRKITLSIVSVAIVFPAYLLIRQKTGLSILSFIDWLKYFIVGGTESSIAWVLQDFAAQSLFLMISAFISAVFTIVLSYGFSLVPYLLETYDISWNEALVKSWELMKGHKRELLLLQITYFPKMLITNFLTNLLIGFGYISPVLLSIPIFFYIYAPILLWIPQMQVATALFFEVLKVEDEENNTNQLFRI